MKIGNSADFYEDSGLGSSIHEMDIPKHFKNKDYGNNAIKLFFVIICSPHNFKVRKRFDNKDKVLYWDIILDYYTVKKSLVREKKIILANSIISSFDIVDKYKKLNLNKDKLKEDAERYFMRLGWI